MRISSDPIRRSESKLVGRIIPVYETNHYCHPIRAESSLICRGEFIKFDAPQANGIAAPPEIGGGYFCRIRVRQKIKMDSGIQIGEDYIFNVAREDLENVIYGARGISSKPELARG